jgi:fucose 4-O-acetylase-like acetyltransferase
MNGKWTMRRWISGALAVLLSANGLVMLFASFWWYGAVDGVTETGPFNPHFVRDIGMAYLVTAGGLGWYAWRPSQGWPALVAAAAFLTLHAAIHVYDAACGREPLAMIARDFAGVFLPALVAVLIALRKPEVTA